LVNPKDDDHDGRNFAAGDDDTGHVVLFVRWTDAVHSRFELYEQTPPGVKHRPDVALSAYIDNGFVPVRYAGIRDSDPV
jgi:hypothetical protein